MYSMWNANFLDIYKSIKRKQEGLFDQIGEKKERRRLLLQNNSRIYIEYKIAIQLVIANTPYYIINRDYNGSIKISWRL